MPRYLSKVLVAAGVYNLVWGLLAIAMPTVIFRWVGAPEPTYPALMQCIGMIVGVYGIGYLIAANNPARHWPIVLVGLLGKIFGPIGFLIAIGTSDFPPAFGWTILLNDVIWWVPFALILWHAFRLSASQPVPEEIADSDGRLPSEYMLSEENETLAELAADDPVMVVFLRHSGCTFHREALSDLVIARPELAMLGLRLAIVHMGAQLELGKHGPECPLTDVARFSDPERKLYTEFGLGHGSFGQLLGPAVWSRGFKSCVIDGEGVGQLDGDGFQMPGVFVIHQGKRLVSYRHKSAGDRPDYSSLAREGKAKFEEANTEQLASPV